MGEDARPGEWNEARLTLLEGVADAVPAALAYFEAQTLRCQFANRRYAELNGWTSQSILGKTVREAIGDAAWDRIQPDVARVLQGQPSQYTRDATLPDGRVRKIEVSLIPHMGGSDRPIGAFVMIQDVTAHWEAQQGLIEAEERMRKFAQATTEGIVFHRDGVITDANEAMQHMLGLSLTEIQGRHVLEFIAEHLRDRTAQYMREGREDPYETEALHRSGRLLPIEVVGKTMPMQGESFRLAVVRDITSRKEAQRRIEYLAHHDALTQLPNRVHMQEKLQSILALAKRHGSSVAVLFVDLDGFKPVNDRYGHQAGDRVLATVAQRILATVRHADAVARIGGDEFLVALSDVRDDGAVATIARKVLAAIAESIDLGGPQARVSASIGISVYPRDATAGDELIVLADQAMYEAKDAGKNAYRFYKAPP